MGRIRLVECYVQHMAILESCKPCISVRHYNSFTNFTFVSIRNQSYRGADKSLARPGRKQATATEDFDVHISYL
jgi:hypothetical protein